MSKPIPLLEVDRVSKSYSQGGRVVHAIQEISFSVEKGEVYGIVGLSGAGKSTALRCLPRLITPTSGKILFCGEDIALFDRGALRDFRRKIGMVFQHFNLLSSKTVAANIGYPLEIATTTASERERRTFELLKLVGLSHKKEAYPSELSGGEKQRVGIARALANHPDLLLCDEATSALDPKTTREILGLLKEINRTLGVTIILITHEMEVIKHLCNQVAVMEQGRIVEKGAVSEVFSDPQHIVTKQFLTQVSHEIPQEFFKELSVNRRLLRLHFKGKATKDPVISTISRNFHVDANILLGWIDHLDKTSMGTLIVELTGSSENIEKTLNYLTEKTIRYEEVLAP